MARSGGDFQDLYQQILRQNKEMAEQNARMMQIMERFGIQENASTRSSSSPEFIIESLASNIREFVYDPENGLVFDRWYRKYEDLFLKDGAKLDDAAKVRLLLRSLSVTVHDKYVNFVLPKHPREFSFEETVNKLKELFSVRVSLFSKRYLCFQLSKNDADDFVTYAGITNKYCEDFELNKITADQFKSLIFICGLRSPKDVDIRTRLLSKLENNAEGECNLESLIAECQRLQNLKHDVAIVEQKKPISSICSVKQNKPPSIKSRSKESMKSKTEGPKTPCWQCGGMHYVRDCTYTKHVCRNCKQTGHKEGYCGCYTTKAASKGKKVNGIYSINQVSYPSRRKFLTIDIDGSSITLQLDTASDISIISQKQWKKMGSPLLTPTTQTARTASGKPFRLLGELRCTVTLGDITKTAVLYVTTSCINLFGLDWIELFGLWDTALSAICNQVYAGAHQANYIEQYKAKFPDVFKPSLGHCKKMKVHLYLKPDARPVFKPKRPVPFTSIEKIDAELDRLQELGIITPVDFSQWAAPIVAVKKPGGKVRICADYSTGLNAVLEPNHYPLPVPDDIFSKLNGCRYFSIIDLSDAYLQVEVDDDSKQLLTINTHRGLFRFNRLAPGVKSAPGAFQQLMNSMVAGLKGVDSFLDDILVYSRTEKEHHEFLHALFQRLQSYGFILKEEKCKLLQPQIKYLGHIVDAKGLRPDPVKIESIIKMPPPHDITSLRSFLGAVNFYAKFVQEMHQLRRPLDALLKKDTKFNWNSECQQSFQRFKEVLQSDLLLTHYDPALPIIVDADASQSGIGACLMHQFPDGTLKAVAHASRSLTSAEANYGQIEKEGLALVFSVTKFHRMLLGRKFTLQTDHQPLLRIFGLKKGIPVHTANRLQRWALTLMCYNFDIEYVSTTQFGYVDVLSRLIDSNVKPDEDFIIASIQTEDDVEVPLQEAISTLPVTFKSVRSATLQCQVLQQVVQHIHLGWPSKLDSIVNAAVRPFFVHRDALSVVKDCVMMSNRLVVPENLRKRIMKQLHRGHPGMERMKAVARSHVYWPGIDDNIADFVKRCDNCITHSKTPTKVPLQSWPLAQSPWERIHIDFAGPINGLHFLVVVDAFSKWPEIRIVRSPTTAAVTEFLSELFARFGIPNVIVSDNGTQFTSEQFAILCKKNGIQHFRISPYHPQSNGQAEKFVDTLKRSLRKINEGEAICETLQTFLQVYRTTPSRVLNGKTPSQQMLGRNMKTILDLLHYNQPKPVVLNYSQNEQFNLKHGALPRDFKSGDKVYAKVYSSNNKWQWVSGVIIENIGRVNHNVLLDEYHGRKKLIRSHTNQLKHRCNETTADAKSSMSLGILVDMFGLNNSTSGSVPHSTRRSFQIEEEIVPVASTSECQAEVQQQPEVAVEGPSDLYTTSSPQTIAVSDLDVGSSQNSKANSLQMIPLLSLHLFDPREQSGCRLDLSLTCSGNKKGGNVTLLFNLQNFVSQDCSRPSTQMKNRFSSFIF
ncbi:uncharacterized protein K02A2.6-like [Sabethes cyaneus]|uniref:uncharacterized protein K02A2.6-like n=1 Tax=Sabethes cyaneus TaxID=53552 RepID=UPI00237D44A5|nr:uncharacterized protein K02A2.6-like [Sabethes cyaneus]